MATHLGEAIRKRNVPAPWAWSAPQALAGWRAAQYLFLAAGVGLVAALLWRPALGLNVLWNGLIPAAPALAVVAPGLWRNICPMATFSLLPRRLGLSRRRALPRSTARALAITGLAALFLIVPLRHLSLDTNGPASAVMLLTAALLAFLLGLAYEWRSGWCNGLCPIHPVEKLYGQAPAFGFANARCDACCQCSTPCPDSTRAMHPLVTDPSPFAKTVGHVMTGSFAGFVWGWYRIPDYVGNAVPFEAVAAFAWPLGVGVASLALYGLAHRGLCRSAASRRLLVRLFATTAVCAYYWYRIPALAGFGPHPGSGMLLDLSREWPALPGLSRAVTTSFFVWFLLLRKDAGISWTRRPARA